MRGDGEGHRSEVNQAETNWSSDTDDARPLAVLTWASVGRAYDGHNQLMVAGEARKARGQRERTKRRMASFSSSDMDLHIYLEHI